MNTKAGHTTRQRLAYYQRIAGMNLRPLWEVLSALVPAAPQSACRPAIWRYSDLRAPLLESGELISAQEATRRVLILENPSLPGLSRVTGTLYAGIQLLNPGEIAPAHRHSQSALRFVLEGTQAFTTVDGERHYMEPGDMILTPAWTWHDHGSESTDPVIWLDGLDIPLVQTFDAGFSEVLDRDQQVATLPSGDSQAKYGANMLPATYADAPLASPLRAYPFSRARDALLALSRGGPVHPSHGYKLRYVNPATGGHVLPTVASFMQLLPAGFTGGAYRSTDATVFVCFEGEGHSVVGSQVFEWGPRDIFVVPSWQVSQHRASALSILFSYSDRAAQERLGLWREQFDDGRERP